ncbi:MAG TPA: hypothetical protein DF984_04560 [Anaerolineaceae bacterium]|nr:hypothetical protein [Anaerolineaceae bacterium]
MPVNLIDIQKKLASFSHQAKAHHQRVVSRLETLQERLLAYADRLDEIKFMVNHEAETNPRLRCAVPLDEPLDSVIPVSSLPERISLAAADGSQINPSHHARVPFSVINVGVVTMACGSGETPKVITESALLDYDTVLQPEGGMLSEGGVAMKRDLRERVLLLEVVDDLPAPAIAMVDGPLELIRDPQAMGGFESFVVEYETILTGFWQKGLTLLGYIDKSQNNLVGRMLSMIPSDTAEERDNHKESDRNLSGVRDIRLMETLLGNPGDRSAIFEVYSRTALSFRPELRLHFFYLNVGAPDRPHLARVEVPAWVAKDKEKVALIQAALLDQTQMMGSRPYPYLLHRAHEEALISLDEHQWVEELIVKAFLEDGLDVGELSNKQFLKDMDMKKTRYQR